MDIKASPGTDIFEGYYTEDPCLYAYKVNLVTEDNTPDTYIPIQLVSTSLNDNDGNTNDLYDELCTGDVN